MDNVSQFFIIKKKLTSTRSIQCVNSPAPGGTSELPLCPDAVSPAHRNSQRQVFSLYVFKTRSCRGHMDPFITDAEKMNAPFVSYCYSCPISCTYVSLGSSFQLPIAETAPFQLALKSVLSICTLSVCYQSHPAHRSKAVFFIFA